MSLEERVWTDQVAYHSKKLTTFLKVSDPRYLIWQNYDSKGGIKEHFRPGFSKKYRTGLNIIEH